MEYYFDVRKNIVLPFATTWMELEQLMLSKICQREKDKYHMISHMIGTESNKARECPVSSVNRPLVGF